MAELTVRFRDASPDFALIDVADPVPVFDAFKQHIDTGAPRVLETTLRTGMPVVLRFDDVVTIFQTR